MPDQDEISKFLAQDSQSLVEQHAKKYGVDPEFAKRILKQESGLRADVLTGGRKSSAGATGPMQLMPATARGLGVDHNDYEQNIEGGVKYLAQLHKQFGGDQTKIAAAYNAGPGAVQRYGGVPPYKETQNYVQRVAQPSGGGASDIEDFLRQPEGAQPAPQPEAAPLRPVRRDQVPGPQKTTARGPVLPKNSNPFAINQGATGFQQQAQAANARTGQISPEVVAQADAKARFNEQPLYKRVGQFAANQFAQGGQQAQQTLQNAVGALARGGARLMNPTGASVPPVDIRSAQGKAAQEATVQRLTREEQAFPQDMATQIAGGTLKALPTMAAITAAGELAGPAAGLAAAGGSTAANADWANHPVKSALETAGSVALPMVGGKIGSAIAKPIAARVAPAVAGPVTGALHTIGAGAANAVAPIAENVYEGKPIDWQRAATEAGIGVATGLPFAGAAAREGRANANRTALNRAVQAGELAPTQGEGGTQIQRIPAANTPAYQGLVQEGQARGRAGIGAPKQATPAEPQAAPAQPETPAQTAPSALPQERLAGIRVLGEAERVPMRDRARAKSIVYSDENGVPQNVRVLLPEGMSLGDAKRVLRDARKYQAQQNAEAAPAQPEATPENPRNRAISRGHEIEQQARAEADAAIQEGRHDDARAALKRRLAALQDTRANIKRDTPGAVALRAQLGEQIFRTQEELRGLKTPAQRPVRPVRPAPEVRPPGNEPTRDLTTPFPQAARVEPTTPFAQAEAPARKTADLPAREQVQPQAQEAAQAPVVPATPTPAAQRPATSANARRRYGRGMDEAVTVHFENQADALRFDASKRGRHAAIGPEADQVAREFGLARREAAGAIYDWRRTVEAAAKSAKPGTDVPGPSFAEFVRARQQAAAQAPEARTPQPPTGPLTEPTNRLQGAEYAGGELPRTAGLRPEGQPVEAPAVALEHFRNAPSREEWDARAIPAEQATSLIQQIRAGIPESKRKGQVSRERATEDLVPVELPLSAIREDTRQWLRESTDQERVNRYAKNLPQTPIYAKPSQRGRGFIVDDGGHRVLAAIQRGAATIKALVPKSAYDRFVELSTDPIDTAPEAKPYEVSDQMARRRQEREAALKGPFGKFAEQARKFAGKEHALASHPEMRRLLDLPEMPDYKRDQRGWTEATHDTMNALAELADQPRSSHIDEDTIKGAWARLERRAEERKAPISDDLRETMADTWERHLTAQDNYQNFIVDGRIDNILRRLDQQHERPISTGEAAELRKAFIDTATKPEHGYELSKNLAEELWKSAKYDAATRAFTRGPRAAQEAVRGGSESARAADVRAEGRAERATGTYGRERDTGRGVSAEAPAPESAPLSDYKRFENANKKAIDTLRSVKPEEAATPAGQRRVDALISRLRKSADQMGVDQKHVDAVVTEAQNAQMEAARAADAEARPSETTPAKAKEPWQMTREEYAKSLLPDWKKHLEADINSANPRMFHPAELVAARELGRTKKELVERKLQGLQSSIESGHERDIQRAVTEGKPVPPEVLADYPDLQAKSAPPVAEMRPRAESEAKAAGEAPALPTSAEHRAMREEIVRKQGKSQGEKYLKAVDRLVSPGDVLEYRAAGPVVLKNGRAVLEVLSGTDEHHSKWRIADSVDVSDQFRLKKPESEAKAAPIATEGEGTRKETYYNGDRAEYTGETTREGLHVLRLLEGANKGKLAYTSESPEGVNPNVERFHKEWRQQQDEFARLHEPAKAPEAKTEIHTSDYQKRHPKLDAKIQEILEREESRGNPAFAAADAVYTPNRYYLIDEDGSVRHEEERSRSGFDRAVERNYDSAKQSNVLGSNPKMREVAEQIATKKAEEEAKANADAAEKQRRDAEEGARLSAEILRGQQFYKQVDADVAKMKGKRREIELPQGKRTILDYGEFGVHNEPKTGIKSRDEQGRWIVTHLKSSAAAGRFGTKQDALRFVSRLKNETTGWDFSDVKKMPKSLGQQGGRILREVDSGMAPPENPAPTASEAAPAKPARKPRVAQDAGKPAGKIDGKDVTADEMAVYDALAKVEPRLSQGAAASFTRARAEAGLSKEAFDKAVASLADKEILSPHYHDFPQSLSPAERAGLVQAGGSDYIGAALRKPGATVERAAQPAGRKPRVKGSVGKLPNETEGGTTLGGGLGSLQGMGKLFRRDTAPPKGAELDAWADQLSRRIHDSMDDATVGTLDDVVNRAMSAASAGDKAAWNKYRRQAEAILQAQPERDIKKRDYFTSPLSNLNHKGTYERLAGETGKEVSELIRNAQIELDKGGDRAEVFKRLRRDSRVYEAALRDNNLPGLAQYLRRHVDYITQGATPWSETAGTLRNLQYNLKLRFNPRSTAVNLLQPFQTLWPHMSTGEYAAVTRDAMRSETKARLDKVFGDDSALAMEGADPKRKWDLFGKASAFNRRVGYLAGERMADRLGLTGEAKDRMARDWAKKVEFDSGRYDAPPIFRGDAASLLLQFKGFQVKNWERIIADVKNEAPGSITGRKARIGKMLLSQVAIGGVRSLKVPNMLAGFLIVGGISKALQKTGMSPDAADRAAETVYYGLPALVGQDFSGSVGLFDEPFGKTAEERVVNFLGGPTISTGVNLAKGAKDFYDAKDTRETTATEKRKRIALKAAKGITPYAKTAHALANLGMGMAGKQPTKTPDLPIGGQGSSMTPAEAIGYGFMGTPVRQTKYYDKEEAWDWEKNLLGEPTGKRRTGRRPASRPLLPPPQARKPKGFGDL